MLMSALWSNLRSVPNALQHLVLKVLQRLMLPGVLIVLACVVQCAMMLAIAEEACEFEHRDLHWGNILIQRQPNQPPAFRLRQVLFCRKIDIHSQRIVPRSGPCRAQLTSSGRCRDAVHWHGHRIHRSRNAKPKTELGNLGGGRRPRDTVPVPHPSPVPLLACPDLPIDDSALTRKSSARRRQPHAGVWRWRWRRTAWR